MRHARQRRCSPLAKGAIPFIFAPAAAFGGAKMNIELPAGDAHTRLDDFSFQTGCVVIHNVDALAGVHTRSVRGNLSPEEALARMLRRKGFTAQLISPPCYYALVPDRDRNGSGNTPAPRQTPESQEEVVVTGSYLRDKGTSTQGLITLTRTDLENGAYTSIYDVLSTLPQVHGGGATEDTQLGAEAQSNFTYGSGINLRGLNAGATLLLVNGEHVPMSGNKGAFADTSMIPLSAVERLEVLPNGTSAIYGADVVGGVVNVIMRRRFRGHDTMVSWGSVTQGPMRKLSLSDLIGTEWRNGGAYVAFEYSQRGALPAGARKQWTSDLRTFGGNDFDSLNTNPGTLIAGSTTWAIPHGQDGTHLTLAQLVPGTRNERDIRADMDALPAHRTLKTYVSSYHELDDDFEMQTSASFSERRTHREAGGAAFTLPVPASNAFYVNPFGGSFPVTVAYDFFRDLGSMQQTIDVQAWSAEAGLVWNFRKDWTLQERVRVANEAGRSVLDNMPGQDALIAALADSNSATALNVFGDGSHTSPATLEAIRTSEQIEYTSRISEGSIVLNGTLGNVAREPIRAALGVNTRVDWFETTNRWEDGSEIGGRGSDRKVFASFGEVALPIVSERTRRPGLEKLELSAAVRMEHYSDVGNITTPRIRATLRPLRTLELGASWARASLAPQLGIVGSASWITPLSALDQQSPSGSSVVLVRFGDNPALRAENASNYTVSVEYVPPEASELRLAVDYFSIQTSGRPDVPMYSLSLLNDPTYAPLITRNPSAKLLDEICSTSVLTGTAATSCTALPITAVADLRTQNAVGQKTRGVDFAGQYTFSAVRGAPMIGLTGTYVLHYLLSPAPGEPYAEGVNTQHNPLALRVRASLEWKPSSVGARAFFNFSSSYHDTESVPPRTVARWTTTDLELFYESKRSSNDAPALRVSLEVRNAFSELPPFFNNPVGVGYDQENGDLTGRMAYLAVRTHF